MKSLAGFFRIQDAGAPLTDDLSAARRQAVVIREMEAAIEIDCSTFLSRTADAASAILKEAKDRKARFMVDLAHAQEEIRQADLVIATLEPVLPKLDGYDPADDAAKSYEAALEAKRQRGDAHYGKRADPIEQSNNEQIAAE